MATDTTASNRPRVRRRGLSVLAVVVVAVRAACEPVRQVIFDLPITDELADLSTYPTLRQVAYAGSPETPSTFGVGVRARLRFRVLALDGPGGGSRAVLYAAHLWS